jgi:hypothetical protein
MAEPCGPHTLDVNVPSASDEAQAHRELSIYLASWQAHHRGVEAYVIEEQEVVG